MTKLDANEVAVLLAELGRRAVLAGGNPYRARAYTRAAESLSALTTPLATLVDGGRLREIPGVGETIADIIGELHRTGTHPLLEEMRKELPAGVLDLLKIPGLRPEKVTKLHKELGITSLAELEAAARADRLKSVKGFGPVLQGKILEGIALMGRSSGARHIHRAAELLAIAETDLAKGGLGLKQIVPAGDFRRGAELVFDLALVAEAPRLSDGLDVAKNGDVAVYVTDPKRLGVSLLLATGSDAHMSELRRLAEAKGHRLTTDGLIHDGKVIASKSEADIYAALGLQFVPPELREGRGEIERAARQALPVLVEQTDIRGILHAHTTASDGVHTLQDMAEATRQRGYGYFGVADHSISAHYAGGLTVEEIAGQHEEIDRLNAAYGGSFRVFKGIESDILADGSLDYPDEILQRFDFVVASIHSRFRMDGDAQTERILRAVANPYTTILGHMTGRQLLRRHGYDVDVETILAACARQGVVVEINANPWRLDLDWRWHQVGVGLGCLFSVNPDAHSTSEIDLIRWGIAVARKGGLETRNILNCLPKGEIEAFFRKRPRNKPSQIGLRAGAAARRSG